jgi:hypothetical protein
MLSRKSRMKFLAGKRWAILPQREDNKCVYKKGFRRRVDYLRVPISSTIQGRFAPRDGRGDRLHAANYPRALFLQEDSRYKRGGCGQEPLQPPGLDSLPVEHGLGSKNQADRDGSQHASQADEECYEGRRGEAELFPDAVEFKVANPTPCPDARGGSSSNCGPGSAANVTETGAYHELGFTTIASLY